MDIRLHFAMVFNLDKCIGCHACSLVCKNIWTDRRGAEYMWWNNVETKPGTGYPPRWESRSSETGDGWQRVVKPNQLRHQLKKRTTTSRNPYSPAEDGYYEPWTYDYANLFNAPAGDDQPTARAVSLVSGKYLETLSSGPNWDDDLGGSSIYAENDPNLDDATEEERAQIRTIQRLVFFYLPRMCNHCVNPPCVAASQDGTIYKRRADGIVLINQERESRDWRASLAACPYKKVYHNWVTGRMEKCMLCYPMVETGQAPACFRACVGRIRYLGLVLYDNDRLGEVAMAAPHSLVAAQRSLIQDPFNPAVIAGAKANGISDQKIAAAQTSPVYKFIKEWGIALPLHPEYRTMPMLFYTPPLLPVRAATGAKLYDIKTRASMLKTLEQARVPLRYMASLFSAGNEEVIKEVYRKLIAVRIYMRAKTVKDVSAREVTRALAEGRTTPEEAEAIHRLTSLPTFEERCVMPPMERERALEAQEPALDPHVAQTTSGFGFREAAPRGRQS